MASLDCVISIDATADLRSGTIWPKSCVAGAWRGARSLGIPATVDTIARDDHHADTCTEDQEILAQLIAPVVPSQAMRISKELILRFGTLPCVLAALDDSTHVSLLPNVVGDHLRMSKLLMSRLLRREISTGPILSTSNALVDYLHNEMARLKCETMRVLFLDANNGLIHEKTMWEGTLSAVQIHPREIIRLALHHHSSALILVHNHPSGNPEPSDKDIAMTQEMCVAAHFMGIAVHDHIIIAGSGHISMRAMGLMNILHRVDQDQPRAAPPRRLDWAHMMRKLLAWVQ